MKRLMFFCVIMEILIACSEGGGVHYEAIYVNDTEKNVLFLWKSADGDWYDTIPISPKDSVYAVGGNLFPLLQENGLRGGEKLALYHVQLIFQLGDNSQRCLYYEEDYLMEMDIRDFRSYENMGECYFCVERAEAIPDGMTYHITDDLLNQAVPCE